MTGTYGSAPPGGGAALTAGRVLAGRFRVLGFLGRGAVGEVYEAEDRELGEVVALKVLRADLARDPVSVARFRREIQLARRVSHPNVCRVFDVFRDEARGDGGDQVFLTMERLRGETLRQRLERLGPMPPDAALAVLAALGEGLAAAHAAGIVHRDLKSGNVFLEPAAGGGPGIEGPAEEGTREEGREPGVEPAGEDSGAATDSPAGPPGERVVITDFGLARQLVGPGDASLTATGELVGSPAYMAPEQVRGEAVTPATDVYALGVVAFELVTGELPFRGDTAVATALLRLVGPPPSPRSRVPDLDPAWERAILRSLDPDPASRPADPRELARSAGEVGGGADGGAGPAGGPLPAAAPGASEPAISTGAAAPDPMAASGPDAAPAGPVVADPREERPAPQAGWRVRTVSLVLVLGLAMAGLLGLLGLSDRERDGGPAEVAGPESDASVRQAGETAVDTAGGTAGTAGPLDEDDPRVQRALALEEEGRRLLREGEPVAAGVAWEEAASLWRSLERLEREAAATYGLGLARRAAGEPEAGMALLEAAVDLFRRSGDAEGLGRALVGLGAQRFNGGRMDLAREAFEEALVVARQRGDDGAAAAALRLLGHSLRMEGDLPQAEQALLQVREIHRRREDGSRTAAADNSLGSLFLEQGRLDEARERFTAALEHARSTDADRAALAARGGLAELALLAGDLDGAAAEAGAVVAGWDGLEDVAPAARARILRGRVALAAGRLDAAAADLETAVETLETLGGNSGLHEALAARAGLRHVAGETAAARDDLERALAQARQVGAVLGGAAILGDLAEGILDEARQGRGVPVEAEALLHSALEVYRRAESGAGEARVRILLARAARLQGKGSAAERELAAAAVLPAVAHQPVLGWRLEIARALLAADRGDLAEARRRLTTVVEQAREAGHPGPALEAAVEAALLAPPAERRGLLERAAAEAAEAGFVLFARRARPRLEGVTAP